MATRAEAFGLKEVADVELYSIPTTGISIYFPTKEQRTTSGGDFYGRTYVVSESTSTAAPASSSFATPKFVFDSLKVSNIEVSSEEATATGGKGNAELISWSYGKEITFTMEDALFSMATFDLMFGANNTVDDPSASTLDGQTIIIDSETFPSNYFIVGNTYVRSNNDGKDEPFIFVIPKAKVNVGGTLTMEADGDPTTFEMSIKALKTDLYASAGTTDQSAKKALVVFHRVNDKSGSAKTHDSLNAS